MSDPIYFDFNGRFGNNLFQYACCRSMAESIGVAFHHPRWIGDDLFDLPAHETSKEGLKHVIPNWWANKGRVFKRSDVIQWFRFKDSVMSKLKNVPIPCYAAHYRAEDYANSFMPIVSKSSFLKAFKHFYPSGGELHFHSSENPFIVDGLPNFVADFYRMTNASVLFRSNSTFSMWAGILSKGRIFSPLIDGVEPYGEREFGFVEGNHPRHFNHPDWDDLHITE